MRKKALNIFWTGLYFLCFALLPLTAQDLPYALGWQDDEHVLLGRGFGGEPNQSVNIRTGKEADLAPASDAFTSLLPEDVRLSWRNSTYSDDRQQVVVERDNDLFYCSLSAKVFRQLTANPAAEQNPTFSPDGRYLAYTRDHNLFVLDLASGLERQLTNDGSEVISNGYASWVYYEEILGRRSRYRAFYWSPDSKQIAFLRFDDTPVPTFPIFHHEAEDMTHGYLEMTRYPKSGDPNPGVRLAIVGVQDGKTTWVDTNDQLEYTAWVFWTPDSGELFFQQMNRDQDTLHIYAADPARGSRRLLWEETQPTWVDFFEDIHFLDDGKGFILRSNRGGWYNLYHHAMNGKVVRNLTPVDWRVTGLTAVNEQSGKVYFEGTGGDGTQSHFFEVGLDGRGLRQLTRGAGQHRVSLSPGATHFVDRFTAHDNPGWLKAFDSEGKLIRELVSAGPDANAEAGIKVAHFTIPTGDGFDLPARWILPPDFDPSKKYPVVFSIYGGPDAGTVYDQYRDYTKDRLVNNGIIVFSVDHRGSGKFGKKGLDYMHRNLGKWEMNDYIESVKWLRTQPFVDAQRIGIQGGSYGGYMSALALTYGADYFTHGVARASVTDWRLYDNVYTERYMDRPQDNPEGYDFGAVMTHADKLKGKLMIIHGTIDDNVHLQQSIQLISKLQDLGKDFDMMLYPGGRHGWGGAKARHSAELTNDFWLQYFGRVVQP